MTQRVPHESSPDEYPTSEPNKEGASISLVSVVLGLGAFDSLSVGTASFLLVFAGASLCFDFPVVLLLSLRFNLAAIGGSLRGTFGATLTEGEGAAASGPELSLLNAAEAAASRKAASSEFFWAKACCFFNFNCCEECCM